MNHLNLRFLLLFLFSFCMFNTFGQRNKFSIIAYFAGRPEQVDSVKAEKITHIIFSFCHLKDGHLAVDNLQDSTTIKKLVNLKNKNPKLKVLLSLGGWGGCPTCANVFSKQQGIKQFSESVLALSKYFKTDGIDLDWEYPAIEGYPGHQFTAEDKKNFTSLVRELRSTLGNKYEISFAAGGFKKFLDKSVEWIPVMKEVDRVNLMTYDLVNGYSITTGHHTPLYSTSNQEASSNNAIQYLIDLGIPSHKLVIGVAFYGRIWQEVPPDNNGLYQQGKFKSAINFKDFKNLSVEKGFTSYWDDTANAPYLYNATQKLFVTYDDKRSAKLKTQYVVDNKLGGIMFWEITEDVYQGGLLDEIDKTKKTYIKR